MTFQTQQQQKLPICDSFSVIVNLLVKGINNIIKTNLHSMIEYPNKREHTIANQLRFWKKPSYGVNYGTLTISWKSIWCSSSIKILREFRMPVDFRKQVIILLLVCLSRSKSYPLFLCSCVQISNQQHKFTTADFSSQETWTKKCIIYSLLDAIEVIQFLWSS